MKGRHLTSAAAVILLLAFSAWTPARAQAPAASQIADAQIYDGFLAWKTRAVRLAAQKP